MSAFLIDPHVHTAETSPCGRLPAGELVRLYLRAGYHGIIITDHYSRDFFGNGRAPSPPEWRARLEAFLTGYKLAARAGREAGLAVFLGLEIKFDGSANDYLVYGMDEAFLFAHPALHTLNLGGFRGLVAGRRVLIVQAHPFREGCRPAPADLLDGLETYNGNPRHESRNHLAARYAREHRLLSLAASDAHQPEDVGRGGMRFPGRLESIHDFIAALADAEPCGAALDGSGPHPAVFDRRRC